MNDYQLTQENISLTRNWKDWKDWKDFRSRYDYWETKDRLIRQKTIFLPLRSSKNSVLKAYIRRK